MKPQDIVFIVILLGLLIVKKPRWLVIAGLVNLALSIPLFAFWIFFTAQRLVEYASAFIFAGICVMLLKSDEKQ